MRVIKTYLRAIALVLLFTFSVQAADVVTFYHTDPVGTPLAMSDQKGEQVWQAEYKPFGEEFTVNDLVDNNRRFVGKEKDDETGLDYFGARYLSVESGRFLAVDPVRAVDEFSGQINSAILANPQRLNVYAYSLNNPYRYVDPDGELAIIAAAIVGALFAYLSAPDSANAPENSSTPIYESQGEKSIIFGAAGGLGGKAVGSAIGAYRLASQRPDYDSGPVTTLYHGGKLDKPGKSGLSTTTDRAHAAQYAEQHGGDIHKYTIPTRRLYQQLSSNGVRMGRDQYIGTQGYATEYRFTKDAVKYLKEVK